MAKNEYHEHLRSVPLFADLDRKELDMLSQASTELRLPAGKVLMSEGRMAYEMFVVLEGTLEVTKDGEHVAEIGPGGFAGEMALLTHAPRHATVTTTSEVTVLDIDGRSFQIVLDEAPMIAVKMLPVVASRVLENSTHHTH